MIEQPQIPYRRYIDGLRAVAVLLVLIFHFDLFKVGDGGFIGVDIFFVISGYLISASINRELDEKRFSLKHFYVKRVRRLAPALIAVQFFILIFGAIILLPSELSSLAKESVFSQLYLSNIYYWRSLNYFGMQVDSSFLLHTWSLGVEEQFYLVYPLILILIHRYARAHLTMVLAALCLASFLLNIALIGVKPEATFYLLPTRAWEMVLGALVARLEPRLSARHTSRLIAGLAGAALVVIALYVYGPGIRFPGWFAALPAGAACLFLLSGIGAGSTVSRLLETGWMRWVGRISYPLYLVHWPIHVFAITLLPDYSPVWRWTMFGLSFLAAWAIYRWAEQPVRAGGRLRGDRPLLIGYAASLAAVLIVTGSMLASGGWRSRFSPAVLAVADVAESYDPVERQLSYGAGPVEPWLRPIGRQGAVPRWFIVGDSHAGALTDAFSLWLTQRGEAGVVLYKSGCMPLLDTGDTGCRAFNETVQKYLATHPDFSSVILTSVWRQPTEPAFTDASGRNVRGVAAETAFASALRRTLDRLRAAGVDIFVWDALPAMPGPVPQNMARNLAFGNHWPTTSSQGTYDDTFRFLHEALDRNAASIAGVIRAAKVICDGDVCRAAHHGRPVFEDNNHPSNLEAAFFARIIADDMASVPPATPRR